ncbi:retrovirus-related pol polyprotein LINE-1 [Tanacetum coccineum]|uniref:Retrovirus-related pol polyprotein LINE-1 n=1 Tax=Tanacetum coccineum TaxID=301880 RepID=A0ABQ4ZVP5_9ASTR
MTVIWGDLNGHIEAAANGYARVHKDFGFGAKNKEGRAILEFATAHDLILANSFFKKSGAHLITFQSGGHNTQIDYFIIRIGDLKACKDCRAIPSEACSLQHRATISEKLSALKEGTPASNDDHMWNILTRVIKDVAKDSLGVASESASSFNGNQEDIDMAKERYKVAKIEAKIAVAHAKDKAYENLYKKLDSKEGANDIYKIAKA